MIYDVCIVGSGMFGSAAARHASANPAVKVCLVGPKEPTPEEWKTSEIFSSYYDSGRITRVLDEAPECLVLAKESIKRYRQLERLSGIKFHTPVGCLFIATKDGQFLRDLYRAADVENVQVTELPKDIFKKRYPYLRIKDDETAVFDDYGGGHINPRELVRAQQNVAMQQGCHIIEGVVSNVTLKGDIYKIAIENEEPINAKRVIVATGAFINTKSFEALKSLQCEKHKETVAMFQLSEEEVKRLSSLPDVIYAGKEDPMSPLESSGYFLPAILYPDGNYYLKIGLDKCYTIAKDLDDISAWYHSNGNPKCIELETKLIQKLLPGFKYERVVPKTCVNCYSPTSLPYIDRVAPTLTVALCGNGKGAKFSDEVGRLAAHLCLTGLWDSQLEKTRFEAIFQT